MTIPKTFADRASFLSVRLLACAFVVLALAFLAHSARAETARDITDAAQITVSMDKKHVKNMLDGSYRTAWESRRGGDFLCFEMPENMPCYGLYVTFSGKFDDYALQKWTESGWATLEAPAYRVNNQYLKIKGGALKFRLFSEKRGLSVSTVRLLSQGELPPFVQQWQPPCEKADLLLLVAHPDDELLWFGGLLPTYAGERGKQVEVVYMTSKFSFRKSELLDGLWLCGVKHAPELLEFPDVMTGVFEAWGGHDKVAASIAAVLRRYRPDVLVTQDVKGEYGHAAHRATVKGCKMAYEMAAEENPRGQLRRLSVDPPWQVKKFYVHLYGQHPLVMDWSVPLTAFDGQTGLEVARQAFACHISQQNTPYHVEDFGPYDCRRLGLYASVVGEDEIGNDLFEHLE